MPLPRTTRASGRLLLAAALLLTTAPTTGAVLPAAAPVTGAATAEPVAVSCAPRPALVDPLATPEARCVAERLDRWRRERRMGVGQQLNVSSDRYLAPLEALGDRPVKVVGFDLEELALAASYEYPFDDAVVADLLRLAADGAVLVATWHARNPHTRAENSFYDRSWRDVGALLRDTPQAAAFWADYDGVLDLLARLQSGEDGALPPAAVVFRPLHEANGDWFWWGHPKRRDYRQVWARMQARAAERGVHNLLWAYTVNAETGHGIRRTTSLLPRSVDLAGLDSYDPERGQPRDRLRLAGWRPLARAVPRVALTEVGPYDSIDGSWRPRLVTRTVRELGIRPLWSMFWFDDPPGAATAYKRQLSSLRGGLRWLDSCPGARCRL